MTVRRCQAEIDSEEFEGWRAFYRIEPFGDWWRAVGEVCCIIAHMVGGLFGGKPKSVPEDWMPEQQEAAAEKRRRSPDAITDAMQKVAEAGG